MVVSSSRGGGLTIWGLLSTIDHEYAEVVVRVSICELLTGFGRGGVMAIMAESLAAMGVAQVEQAIGNVGGFRALASA